MFVLQGKVSSFSLGSSFST